MSIPWDDASEIRERKLILQLEKANKFVSDVRALVCKDEIGYETFNIGKLYKLLEEYDNEHT